MLFAACHGRIIAPVPSHGGVIWEQRLSGGVLGHLKSASMTLPEQDPHLYTGANGHVICPDRETGTELWRHDIKGARASVAALSLNGRNSLTMGAMAAGDGGGFIGDMGSGSDGDGGGD